MKAFRSLVLGVVLVAGAATVASAQAPAAGRQDRPEQQRSGRMGRHGGMFARAALRDVNLTEAQKTQLRDINKKYAAERRTLMQDVRGTNDQSTTRQRPDSATRAQLRTKVQALGERERADVRAILTAEQQRQFDANVAALRDHAKSRRANARA